jgi:Flp pilus assembly secretin CpaC
MVRFWVAFALLLSSGSGFAQTALVSTNSAQPISVSTNACIRGTQYPGECATIEIDREHSRLLKLDRQFQSVIVGNPEVADVHIEDMRTVVITAKSRDGKTNIMFLNAMNEPMYAAEVVVTLQPQSAALGHAAPGRVIVYGLSKKGLNREYFPYACSSADCLLLQAEQKGDTTDKTFTYATQPNQNNQTTNINGPIASAGPSGHPDAGSDDTK